MMKSLLLATAAGLSVVSLAQAADVPMDKAEAVEYVKVCSEFGTGFFYIPGTDTCLQISGYVHSTASYSSSDVDHSYGDTEDGDFVDPTYSTDSFDMKSEAQINFDARTATEYGTLRSFISIRGNHANGSSTNFEMHNAYLQLGGFAAGFNTSAFAYFDNIAPTVLESYYSSGTRTNFFSYTATFGDGFFATAAVESRQPRANDSGFTADTDMPDFVGVIGVKQGWGDVRVMAAAHQAADVTDYFSPPTFVATVDTKTGYAVGAGATINLGMAGAKLMLEGLYADGALSYLGGNSSWSRPYLFSSTKYTPKIGDTNADGDTSTGYSLSAALSVDASPSLNLALTGSYQHLESTDIAFFTSASPYTFAERYAGYDSIELDQYAIGGTATYTVTPGFSVAASVAYTSSEMDGTYHFNRGADTGYEHLDNDGWTGGVRVKRTF